MKMSGISGACGRLIGELVHALGVGGLRSTSDHPDQAAAAAGDDEPHHDQRRRRSAVDHGELVLEALTAVFGMENNGRINKEKARQVVENLGLIEGAGNLAADHISNFDIVADDQVAVEEVVAGLVAEDGSKRKELLRQAFRIFDEDGNGFIDAFELKRVLQCLGLDNGWDMAQIHNMLKVVDLNLDGKVDFTEFQFMMMMS